MIGSGRRVLHKNVTREAGDKEYKERDVVDFQRKESENKGDQKTQPRCRRKKRRNGIV